MVAMDQTPIKTMKIGLGEGSITADPNAGRIRVDEDDDGVFDIDTANGVGVIEYQKGDRRIAYENGGVWEIFPGGGSVELSEPRIFIRDVDGNIFVSISIINIIGDLTSVGGSSATIISEYSRTENPRTSITNTVIIEITSDYADAWARYLNEIVNVGDTVNTAGNVVTAEIAYDKLIVNEYFIEVEVN